MKITLDLPDGLMHAVKIRAAEEGRELNDTSIELLRSGLLQPRLRPNAERHEVSLPLIQCGHPARPEEEITPERAAEILLAEEVAGYLSSSQP